MPADLTDPNICGDIYKNVYRPYLPDPNLYLPQYDTITNIASRLTNIAEQNILVNGGYITYDPNKTYHIPDACEVIPQPEMPDPNGPKGLVADAINAGINVTATAAVEYYIPTSDRRNLDAIIDGITDNSYNGHKPYYSYLSTPEQRPQQDWYQLNFSKPVKFDALTFYEGDIVWSGINTYYKVDSARGGFFSDLAIQIFRDGNYITPANLQMSPVLDRYKMYQQITFTFAPTVGDAIRIIGTPGGTASFTTIMELEVEGVLDPNLYIASVIIADGLPQRSNIDNIEINFSHDVTITKNDIFLCGTINSTVIDMNNVGFNYDSPTRWLTLSFASQLPDDAYQLKLDCAAIIDSNNTPLLDDDSNPADGFYTIEFHKLFGDTNGSADVNLYDFSTFASYWLGNAVDTGLDVNKDDILNFLDLAAFADNWLKSYP